MPAKKPDSETVEVVTSLETTADPSAQPATPAPAAPSETAGTTETTEATVTATETVAPDLTSIPALRELVVALAAATAEPTLIDCVTLHGRLTHDGKTYNAHETVQLPPDLARGLIAAGHVAKVE